MRVSIFVGPSISLGDAREILPDATYHPPAAKGDLLAARDLDDAEVVGLIDGTFHQNLSVWHNEVCYLLSLGIAVYGASSMGALRAAETDCFGMRGVGRIYEWYRDGVVVGDDEVALIHGDAESDYLAMSIPLVNVRASAIHAVESGKMSSSLARRLVNAAQSLYYPDRCQQEILNKCRQSGFTDADMRAARDVLSIEYVDLKRSDALELLQTIRSDLRSPGLPAGVPDFVFARSSVFDALYNLDRRVNTDDAPVTLQDVAQHLALYCTTFREIRRAALDRDLVVFLANLLALRARDEDVASERSAFLQERGLVPPDKLKEWLVANSMSEDDLWEYLADDVLCRQLRSWMQGSRGLDRGCRAVLDELRVRGDYPYWAAQAVDHAAIVAAFEHREDFTSITNAPPAELAERHAVSTGVRITGDASLWADEAGFDGVEGLLEELRRAALADSVRIRARRILAAAERASVEDLETSKRIDVLASSPPRRQPQSWWR